MEDAMEFLSALKRWTDALELHLAKNPHRDPEGADKAELDVLFHEAELAHARMKRPMVH